MLTPIDMKEWEKTCREKTGLGFETFKTVTHCDAETPDALLEAASGSIKGTMYFDWLIHDTVHTAIVMTLVLAVVSLAGILLIPLMLDLMKTPEEVVPESTKYLTIYFAGMVGLMLYNMGSGILRAVGDSKRPFYFLVVSAVINTVLDLLFVCVFGMGVEGVAYATIIAQGVSGVPCDIVFAEKRYLRGAAFSRFAHPSANACQNCENRHSVGDSAGYHRLFQCVCAVVYQFLWRGLHGRLDGLFQNRPVCAAAYAVDFHCKHNSLSVRTSVAAMSSVPKRVFPMRLSCP